MPETWVQTFSIILSVIATGYYLHREIQIDIRSAREENKSQSLRTDRLYEMFIDLVKEGKK